MRRHRQISQGASRAVIAALLVAQPLATAPALAAGFAGAPTTTLGSVGFDRSTANVDTITVNSAQATVNWVPTDTASGGGSINFLPAGNTANYVAGANSGNNYTILNRIIAADPARGIAFNGLVTSAAGGAVWFYAPGGILVGATGQFNVGSLLLTANDPIVDAKDNFLVNGNQFSLAAAAGSTAAVDIAAGATITATAANSYVIAVAPRVRQAGAIDVNGSAALVAAEAVDFTLNAGLFDISATVGTGVAAAIDQPGSITGPAAKAGEFHRIYLVAIPKNDAITMFITGAKLGFEIAGAADLVGNTIVLSAGHNVADNGFGNPISPSPGNATAAHIVLDGGDYTSALIGRANGDAIAQAATGNASFAGDVRLTGLTSAGLAAHNGFTLGVAGSVQLTADSFGGGSAGASHTGGTASIVADKASALTIAGSARATARASGDGNAVIGGTGGTGTGGTARILAQGGAAVGIGGTILLDTSGVGGRADSGRAGNGIGGTSEAMADTGGSLALVGDTTVVAQGTGAAGGNGRLAGDGIGGRAALVARAGSTLTILGGVVANADGAGGGISNSEASGGGNGVGGDARISAGDASTVRIGSDTVVSADATGGDFPGGNATGGAALAGTFGVGGRLTVAGQRLEVTARATGGRDFEGGGAGGNATGGTARVFADGGTVRTLSDAGNALIAASATGGAGTAGGAARGGQGFLQAANGGVFATAMDVAVLATAAGGDSIATGAGGDASGDLVRVDSFAGAASQLQLQGSLRIDGSAQAGRSTIGGGNGGNAAGAAIAVEIRSGNLDIGTTLDILSGASGGRGLNGGNAVGGAQSVLVRNAGVTVAGATTASARASGGNGSSGGGSGGAATGGKVDVIVGNGGSLAASGLLTIVAGGTGGDATNGNGGDARGGTTLVSSAGTMTLGSGVSIDQRAFGGNALVQNGSFTGGSAVGGTIGIVADGGAIAITGRLDGLAGGSGGSTLIDGEGSGSGDGGAGAGGTLQLLVANSGTALVSGAANLDAGASGGDGAGADSRGGSASGGLIDLRAGTGAITLGDTAALVAAADGGSGFSGGDAAGGKAFAVAENGSVSIGGAAMLIASAAGGAGGGAPGVAGGTGGAGLGGSAEFTIIAPLTGAAMTAAAITADVTGRGGRGGQGDFGLSGGAGGSGRGGSAQSGSTSSAGTLSAGILTLDADGFGGAGGSGAGTGNGGSGGAGSGGAARAGTNTAASGLTGNFAWDRVDARASGTGGSGGSSGSSGLGGGTGGAARGGTAGVGLNGGIAVVAGPVTAIADASGGAGGEGGTLVGNGGNADAGLAFAGVVAHSVAGNASRLTAGATTLSAAATAGTGAVRGIDVYGRTALFAVDGSTDLASADLRTSGTAAPAEALPSGAVARGGTITIAGRLGIVTPGDVALGADNGSLTIGGALTAVAGGRAVANFDGRAVAAPGIIAAGSVLVTAPTSIFLPSSFVSASSLVFTSGGAITLGNLTAIDTIDLVGASTVTTGNIRSEQAVRVVAADTLVTGTVSAGNAAELRTTASAGQQSSITSGAIDAGIVRPSADPRASYGVNVSAAGAARTGDIAAQGNVAVAANGAALQTGAIAGGRVVVLLAGSGVTSGGIRTAAGGTVYIASDSMAGLVTDDANGNPDFSALLAARLVRLAGDIGISGAVDTGILRAAATGSITIGGAINASLGVQLDGGNIILADLTSGGFIDLLTDSNLALGDVRAETDIGLAAAGDIVTGAISAGDSVSITATPGEGGTGRVTTGAIDAGMLRPSPDRLAGYQVGIVGADAVRTGAVAARGNIGVVSRTAGITLGAVGTTGSFLGLASSGFAADGVTTGAAGVTYVGNASMNTQLAGIDALGPPAGFDFAPVFGLAPVRVAGPVAFGGPVVTGRLTTAGTGSFSGQAVTAAQSVTIDSGGLASFGGQVAAPLITVNSADIAIAATGGLGAAGTTQVNLNIASTVASIAIGGSNADSAYVLDNDEAGRLRGQAITIAALGAQPARVVIGTLGLMGSGLAANGNSVTVQTAGSIRVDGAAGLTGAGPADTLRLRAGQRIEVATDRGGRLGLTGTAGALAGVLDLAADSIWVGTADLIGQLAQNVGFAGRDALLGRAAAVPDLVGGLAAGGLTVAARSSFLVQNSGSPAQRAGFSAGAAGFQITAAGAVPLDVVINGRALDTAGVFAINNDTIDRLTLVKGEGASGFTATSSVNGCIIGVVCKPDPRGDPDTLAAIANISTNLSETALSPAAEKQRDTAREATERLPEVRIAKLVDMGEDGIAPLVTDPVTSTGNPALWIDVPGGGAGASIAGAPAPGGRK